MEQMKRLRAENVELKKELLRLQHLEDQVQLLREENELILGWKYCEKRKVSSLASKNDRAEQCLRSCGSEFQT